MSFREFTNHECQLSRDTQPSESLRTALESKVLQSLDDDIAKFLQSGGKVITLPARTMSEHVPRGLQGPTASQKAAIEKRVRESGGVVR